MSTLSAYEQNLNDLRRAHEQCELMRQWAFNTQEQVDMCVELERELGVPDWLMARVHKMRRWYLLPSAIYPSLEAYTDAMRAALVADVRAYQAEVAAAEAAHRKRRRERHRRLLLQHRGVPLRGGEPRGQRGAARRRGRRGAVVGRHRGHGRRWLDARAVECDAGAGG